MSDSTRVRLYRRVWQPLAPFAYTLIAFLGSLSPSHTFWYRGGNEIAVHPFDLDDERDVGRAEETAKGIVEIILWGVGLYASLFLGIAMSTEMALLFEVSSLLLAVVAVLLISVQQGLEPPHFEPMYGGEEA